MKKKFIVPKVEIRKNDLNCSILSASVTNTNSDTYIKTGNGTLSGTGTEVKF